MTIMKVAIIGGGITGLTAGYHLAKQGIKVEIFEKKPVAGGLATSFKNKNWNWPLEGFFHHIFTSDREILNLAKELGIDDKIFLRQPLTSTFINQQIFPIDSPPSLLKFPHLSFVEKIRTGVAIGFLKLNPFWQPLEKVTAVNLLPKLMGKKSYQTLWEPLFKAKFGQNTNQVSAAWFWARIKKRSQKLGYFQGGFQTLVDTLIKEIKKNGGKIHLETEVKKITTKMLKLVQHDKTRTYGDFDKILVTTPMVTFLKIAPPLPAQYQKSLKALKMVGAINLVLELKKPFLTDNTYWLNINDSSFPFCAVVEHTNFIDKKNYNNKHIIYMGGYYPQNHPYFKMNKAELLKEFLPYLQKINPALDISHITYKRSLISGEIHISQSLYAQPIMPINYSQIKPSIKTPVSNLFLTTLHHVYPWDRGVNYAIKLGKEAANEIIK